MKKITKKVSAVEIIIVILLGVAATALLAVAIYFITDALGIAGDQFIFTKETKLAFLAISYQVIFLTTSLLSLLSDKEETIFWERFTEFVLVSPRFFNFIGLSSVGFATLVMQTAALFFDDRWGNSLFYGSFLLGIIVIIILYYKMSSVYFNRQHYADNLKKKELTAEHLKSLAEYSYVAADRFNGRIVFENVNYLMDKISEDPGNAKEAIETLISIFEHLDNRDLDAWIISIFRDSIGRVPADSQLYSSIVSWIMKDKARIDLWQAFIAARGQSDEYKRMLACVEKYIRTVWEELPFEFDEGEEHELKYLESFAEDMADVETIRRSFSDYEREILGIVSFVFENNLRDEQEELTDILLRNPDPVACRPSNSPVMESEIQDGIMLRIIRMIRDDDLLLTNFILIYEVVLCTMAHGNVKWNDRRDEAIVKMLVNAMENKAHPEPELETVFDCFISENVPFRSAARKNHVRHLAEGARSENGRSIRALRNLVDYDYTLDRQISGLEQEEDRTPEEIECMEKNLKSAISFWKEIKDTVSGGKKRCKDLAALLDEYITFMKNERDQL